MDKAVVVIYLVVSFQAIYFHDPGSNPAEINVTIFLPKAFCILSKWNNNSKKSSIKGNKIFVESFVRSFSGSILYQNWTWPLR